MAETRGLQECQRGAHPLAHRGFFKEGEQSSDEPAPSQRSSQELW